METKLCSVCNTVKLLYEFVKDKHEKTGYTYRCKQCRSVYQKKWRDENPDRVKELNKRKKIKRDIYYKDPDRKLKYRRKYIEKTFNIEYSIYEKLENDQNNLCAICNLPEKSIRNKYLSIDHDHKTGKIRGLLCSTCNTSLGQFYDSPIIVNNALQYLLKHNQ